MRRHFAALFDYIAECLNAKVMPDEAKVLEMWQDGSDWPPNMDAFLQLGGRVSDALEIVFDHAMDHDEYTGDGEHLEACREPIAKLKKCRNAHEFGVVRRFCGLRVLDSFVDFKGVRLVF